MAFPRGLSPREGNDSPESAQADEAPARETGPDIRRRRIFLISAGAAAIAVGVASYWLWSARPAAAPAANPSVQINVPVSVAAATRQDVPVYLTGLGVVEASLTVGIRPQVDGTLQEVLFTEGQEVKKGDVLARIDPRLFEATLDQARGEKARNAALLASAGKTLDRLRALELDASIARETVDHQQATVDQLTASIAVDEAAIEAAQTRLDHTSIRAPGDGRIGIRLIDAGNVVRASDTQPIAILTQTRPIAVLFTLPARALGDVRGALARGPVEVTAFDQDNRHVLGTGELLLIDNAVDPATDSIRLKAIFPNDDERLWPGQFVNARLSLEVLGNALVVPSTALQRGPQGLFVWVVTAEDTAEPRPVETGVGPAAGELTVITSGLGDAERVVTHGQFNLTRDARVRIMPPPVPEGVR